MCYHEPEPSLSFFGGVGGRKEWMMMQGMRQMEAVQCITVARIEWQEDSTPWFQIWLYEQLAAYKRSTKTWWIMTWCMMMITKATGWVARKESLSVSGKESPSVSGFGLKEEMGTSYENLFVRQTTPTHTHTRICAHPHTRTHIITHTRTHTRTNKILKPLHWTRRCGVQTRTLIFLDKRKWHM